MRLLLVLGALALSVNIAPLRAAEHTSDSLETVKERLTSGEAILVDVRELSEWEEGHLKGARLLSLSRLRKGIPSEELAKILTPDKVIYAHCAAGFRCLETAERLKRAGYEVRALKPGYKALLDAGFEKAAP
ncbi:MAG: rhodanese-like domain-containing protein [Planctomycetaceae bacterium]|nr:rhodanese-like domain-containing protein [Planctomycetaceae bacterium]